MTVTRPIPPTSALTDPYWRAAGHGRLDLQHCASCDHLAHPPAARCPACGAAALDWRTVGGRGTVYTFTIAHRAPHPAFADALPLVVAIIELDEGPRMTSNVVECDPEQVRVGMPVEVTFLPLRDSDIRLPVFRPAN